MIVRPSASPTTKWRRAATTVGDEVEPEVSSRGAMVSV
jgi:hypothetical protein